MGEHFQDFEIGKDFLTVHKKALIIKSKTNKLKTSIPLKTSFREDYNRKMIIFKDKELISTIFKPLLHTNKKCTDDSNKTWTKDLNRHLTKNGCPEGHQTY